MKNWPGGFAALALFVPALAAAQVDMQEMMKWGQSQFVHYHVIGVHEGKASVSSTGAGFADIKDRVEIDFLWDLAQGLIGDAKIENTASTTSNLRDSVPQCLPPVLKGPFEFYDVRKIEAGVSLSLKLFVTTTYPVVEVAHSCTASRHAEPAKVIDRPEELVVPSPMGFAMGTPDSVELQYHKQTQHIVFRKNGWVWTFAPTVATK
jgi:hypothetical protein